MIQHFLSRLFQPAAEHAAVSRRARSGEVSQAASEIEPAAEQRAEPSSLAQLADRYAEQLQALIDDALERRSLPVLIDVLTWAIARFVVAYGHEATGDVLSRLGSHIRYLSEHQRSVRDADAARNEGRKPH
jgi:hypothetical protein